MGLGYSHVLRRGLSLLILLAVGTTHIVLAQQNPSSPLAVAAAPDDESLEFRIVKRVDEVNLRFTVTDSHGRFQNQLTTDDFFVLDNHQPPAAIHFFQQQSTLPMRVGILIDVSSSVASRFKFEQKAAGVFLKKVLRPGYDEAFVVTFDNNVRLLEDWTSDPESAFQKVHALHAGGETALYDAVYHACKEKFLKDRPDRPARKAIVIVSDGEDNQSEVTKAQAIEMAQRSEVIIYAISTDDSGLVMRGDRVLEQLAEATGGRAFFPFKMKDITRSFAAIEDELRSQYVVSYKPADFDADGRYRSIEISTLKKDLQVRARKGYFAPQQ